LLASWPYLSLPAADSKYREYLNGMLSGGGRR
jgi:hypothetical protein